MGHPRIVPTLSEAVPFSTTGEILGGVLLVKVALAAAVKRHNVREAKPFLPRTTRGVQRVKLNGTLLQWAYGR